MRLLHAKASYFGSFKEHLIFYFNDAGPTLIQGATGSGKSTLCDIVPWVLFGKTAKGGTINEVLTWNSEEATFGTVVLEINGDTYKILRLRGKVNELYILKCNVETDKGPIRGKDNTETQQIINQLIGLDYETYLLGAYYNETSPAAGFFTAKASQRRSFMEQLVDLSLATKLKERAAAQAKDIAQQQAKNETEITQIDKMATHVARQIDLIERRKDAWENERRAKIKSYAQKSTTFEEDKEKEANRLTLLASGEGKRALQYKPFGDPERIADLEAELLVAKGSEYDKCNACGQHLNLTKCSKIRDNVYNAKRAKDIYDSHIEAELEYLDAALKKAHEKNTYAEQIKELEEVVNPHADAEEQAHLTVLMEESQAALEKRADLASKANDLALLGDLVEEYRTTTVGSVIMQLEDRTNGILSTYFDGEFQVQFTAEESDKIDVVIFKDGNQCTFTQLSKGQRQMLKLSFSVSVMEVIANQRGVHFNALFLDEAFDGLDEGLKVKAFNLITMLATKHESVFVVEHSEALKSRFLKRFSVTLNNGVSVINEEA